MPKASLILRSSIQSVYLRNALWRGTFLAIAGATGLLLSGVLLPAGRLATWGLPIFLLSMALITWGLLPYRRLRRLENTPNRVTMDQAWLHFASRGKSIFSVAVENIANVEYLENKKIYGIVICLKEAAGPKLQIHQAGNNLTQYRQIPGHNDTTKKLFLPYFSQRAFLELQSFIAA